MIANVQTWFLDYLMVYSSGMALLTCLLLLAAEQGLGRHMLASKDSGHFWLATIVFVGHLANRYLGHWMIELPPATARILWYTVFAVMDVAMIVAIAIKVRLLGVRSKADDVVILLSFVAACIQIARMSARQSSVDFFPGALYYVGINGVNFGLAIALIYTPTVRLLREWRTSFRLL